MSRLVVFGATGQTGRLVVERALDQGHVVTAAARRPDGLAELTERWSHTDRLSVVVGDVRVPAQVSAAVRGCEVAISAIACPGRHPDGLFSRGTRGVIDGLRSEGVPRLLCVSSRGVQDDDRGLPLLYRKVIRPWFLHEVYADMTLMEQAVRGSGLEWTLVRPPRLTDGPARGGYRVADAHNPPGGWTLSRADLAAFLVDEIDTRRWARRAPTLAY